jgi:FlaA1/EpsC-like NDP-sugar epimerase
MKRVISKKLLEMEQSGVKRVAFFGVSDEMEIAYITLQGSEMKLVGIVDEDGEKRGKRLLGHKVLNLGEVRDLNPDAILITSMQEQASYIKTLTKQKGWDSIKIFTI